VDPFRLVFFEAAALCAEADGDADGDPTAAEHGQHNCYNDPNANPSANPGGIFVGEAEVVLDLVGELPEVRVVLQVVKWRSGSVGEPAGDLAGEQVVQWRSGGVGLVEGYCNLSLSWQ
jgi:hypothetical protein